MVIEAPSNDIVLSDDGVRTNCLNSPAGTVPPSPPVMVKASDVPVPLYAVTEKISVDATGILFGLSDKITAEPLSCQLKEEPLLGSTIPGNTSAVVPAIDGLPGLPAPLYKTTDDEGDVPYSSPNFISKDCTDVIGLKSSCVHDRSYSR